MAGELTQRGAELALDAAGGRQTVSARTMYLALLTADPGDNPTLASLAEITTGGYARQAVAWTAPTGDPSSISNSAQLVFGPFSGDPPNVTYCALVSAASGTSGECTMKWALDVAKDAATGESITFAVGALTMTND